MRKIMMALALGAMALPAVASADVGIDIRQANQQRQIDAGKRSGKLTRNERSILTSEQYRIKREEGRLRARGGFGNRDQAYIQGLLDRAQRNIDRLKNNRTRTRGSLDI
jgi:opacity protein-like surface antigen